MAISFKEFRDEYLELMLNFLWRQWSQLGVFGEITHQDDWVIDPETLLLITMELGRSEPRMFDEVIDWLVINGKWLNVQRLNNIVRLDNQYKRAILSAVAEILAVHDKSAKWRRVSKHLKAELIDRNTAMEDQPFFFFKDGKPIPVLSKIDETFKKYGFLRSPINLRGLSKEIQTHSPTNLWFKLRALFGVNLRADIIVYLITHDSAHPRRVARELIFSQPRVQTTMVELALTGLIRVKPVGHEKHYWLNRDDWWQFINPHSNAKKPQWVNWVALLSGLTKIWRWFLNSDLDEFSEFIKSSELRKLMEDVRQDMELSGLISQPTQIQPYQVEDYVKVVMNNIKEVLG